MTTTRPLPYRLRNWILLLCVLAWVSAFVATHLPPAAVTPPPLSDKWLHLLGYFVLGAVLEATLAARRLARPRRIAAVLVVLPLYAAFDEITQPLVGRQASLLDWTMDLAGSLAAIAIVETLLLRAGRAGRR